jgi:hypothetical protein
MVNLGRTERLDAILRLLNQQRQVLNHWPLTNEQIRKDKEISARIRSLIDQMCTAQPIAGTVSIQRSQPKDAAPSNV